MLELSLGRYAEALSWGLRIYDGDPPGFGSRVLPEIVEAGARAGDDRAALGRLADRATASGTPWALGMLARSRALLAPDSGADALYREAIAHLTRSSVRTELARAHLLYGEWLRRQKRRKRASAQLRTAYSMFDAMGAAAFARRTRAEPVRTQIRLKLLRITERGDQVRVGVLDRFPRPVQVPQQSPAFTPRLTFFSLSVSR